MSNTMEQAMQVLAELLAKKAAKRHGTESTKFVEGYALGIMFCAKNPDPLEMLTALGVTPVPTVEPSETD